jgi:hypothetical protein
VIDHRHLEQLLGPDHRVGIGALAGQEERAKFRQVVGGDQLSLRVFLLDGAKRGRSGEQSRHAVLGDHPPEGAGIGRADRLALVQDRGAAVQERGVHDVAVPHHPADIGRRPKGLARLDPVEIAHRPLERHHVAAVVAHHPLGPPGRA